MSFNWASKAADCQAYYLICAKSTRYTVFDSVLNMIVIEHERMADFIFSTNVSTISGLLMLSLNSKCLTIMIFNPFMPVLPK